MYVNSSDTWLATKCNHKKIDLTYAKVHKISLEYIEINPKTHFKNGFTKSLSNEPDA